MFDPGLHVAHHIRHCLHIKPGVLEPVDRGLAEVEGVVGVGDGVQGDDEAEAVPGRAGHDHTLTHAGQLQPHPLLHGRDHHLLLRVQLDKVRAASSHCQEALLVHEAGVSHPEPVLLCHQFLKY